MAHVTIRPHELSPEEISRRQRWVAVGVVVLVALLIVTWFATLPGRISSLTGGDTSTQKMFGEIPQANFIDTDEILK